MVVVIETKKVAILQSNYIPWKGYFDIIARADVFVIYDNRQYTKRDWRNRNRIKTPSGSQWLTIPIKTKGYQHQKINEAVIQYPSWMNKHLKSLEINYRRAEYFPEVMEWLSPLYLEFRGVDQLSTVNTLLLKKVSEWLNIDTKIVDADSFFIEGTKSQTLLSILKQIGNVTHYISGPSASSYLDEALFAENQIEIEYMDYTHYPIYRQLFPPFIHEVSILDLIFNEGRRSHLFLKYLKG